jgi:putative endonuclease
VNDGRARGPRDRRHAERRGRRAETLATLLLRLKGHRILARRYRCRAGEIDILALRGTQLVAVEVKARGGTAEAAEAITSRQQARIARAFEHFVAANPCYAGHDMRFDAILAAPRRLPRHVPDAWRIE